VAHSAREVVEEVRRMVAGEGVVFADLFAEDGVLEYPFAAAGQPRRLQGRQAIKDYFRASPSSRALFDQDDVKAIVHETADPEVVVAQIEHHGTSRLTGQPYNLRAIGVIRVRGGEIISYQDYMDSVALAQALNRTESLIGALRQP
jgi:ketosteroid isomerase-like protein